MVICNNARPKADFSQNQRTSRSSEVRSNGVEMDNPVHKDRRKPELQIYRPKMGLNKNARVDDSNLRDVPVDDVRSAINNSENVTSSNSHGESKSSNSLKSSRKTRNRRPDMQVYVPKAKIAAQLSDKVKKIDLTKLETKNECENETSNLKLNLSKLKNNNLETRNKNSDINSEKNLHSNLISKCSNSSSPVPTSLWADIMEESDRSTNPRSTPEEDLWNNPSDDSDSLAKNKVNHSEKSSKSNSPNEGNQRSRRNSLKNDRPQKIKENCQVKNAEFSQTVKKLPDNSSNHAKAMGNRSRQNARFSTRPTSSISVQRSVDREVFDKPNKPICASNTNGVVKDCSNKYVKSHTADNKPKLDKKKWEKVEQVLPPRFQKNKTQNFDSNKCSSTGQNGSGGILKLPTQYDIHDTKPEVTEDNFYTPKMFPETQTFIHKQLFDPNNPNKPEIVNIPAPVPPSHMPYKRLNPPYYAPENLDPSYIAAPVPSVGYIPPPQPVAVNRQFRFVNSDFAHMNTSSNSYMDTQVIPPPVQCPAPVAPFPRLNECYSEIPNLLPDSGKKRLKPIVEKNLRDIVFLEKELASLLTKGFSDSNMNAMKQCRWKLQLRYENVILADPKYCAEKNPEQSLWKTVYHQVIESLRKKLEEQSENHDSIKQMLLNVIEEGTTFYENLLEKQQETYGFKLTKILELEHISTACLPDQLRCVLFSVQKSLIYLGDLARYKEQVSGTSNFGKARSWYLKAQQIAPKNGRPYHQLAILAFNTRRKLDAVYYYMRSLAASNPFLSAKESLLTLFEEARKKYELYDKKRVQENVKEKDNLEDDTTGQCEIWIKNDGSSSQSPADRNIDSSDLADLSDVLLNKRFVVSFLHVHGKLFTKIGMETFPDVLKTMLKEFYCLLHRTPLPLTASRILQILAINIFSVTYSSLKEPGREHGGYSILQEQALYTSMAMMSLLMERCVFLYVTHKSSPNYPDKIICDDMALLLPAVKIWTDWMSCQKCLWASPPSRLLERLDIRIVNQDVWEGFANLLTTLREIDTSKPVILEHKIPESEALILEEDSTFAGFVPLLDAAHNPAYAVQPYDKEKARYVVRINRIQFFGDYLCGIVPSYMEFNVESKKFVSLVNEMSLEESLERNVLYTSTEDSYREESFDTSREEENMTEEKDELQALWSRKDALSRAKAQQERHRAQVQAVLQNDPGRPIVLKIQPRYLVPDTNCFIDHLCHFRSILTSSDFHVVIPLVVINELDGLARGNRVNEHSTPEHTSRVTALSKEAILFLEQQFASRHPHLRAITSKGSILDTISFRSEEMGKNKGTNDDLILTCCLNYCKDRAESYMPKKPNESVTLFREVVLLTDDRNLRIKALAHHVPVRDLLSFLQWANS